MRPRRVLVRVAGDVAAAVASSVAALAVVNSACSTSFPPTAVLQQQRRWIGRRSPRVLAPRRRTATESAKRKTKEANTVKPQPTATVRTPSPSPPSSPVAQSHKDRDRENASEFERPLDTVGLAQPPEMTTMTTTAANTAGVVVPSPHDRSAAVLERSALLRRRKNARVRSRLLVGAHSAIQSKDGKEDCRAYAPRLHLRSMEERSEGEAEDVSEGRQPLQLWRVELPPVCPGDHPALGITKTEADPALFQQVLRTFASTFALTLHSTPLRWRIRIAAATAVPFADSPSSVSSSGTTTTKQVAAPSSFLSSPMAIMVAQTAVGSLGSHTFAMEIRATLRWLQASFRVLCERLATEVFQEHRQSAYRSGSEVFARVQDSATALLSAIEEEARAPNSKFLSMMRRECRREAAAAAAAAASVSSTRRKRKIMSAAPDAKVKDTLQNTLERAGLELHLIHAWIVQLCSEPVEEEGEEGKRANVSSHGGAVGALAQRALRWKALQNESAPAFSLDDVRWMLATALVAGVLSQKYRLHAMKVRSVMHTGTAATSLTEAATRGQAKKRVAVVEYHTLGGLSALVDFAFTQRSELPVALSLRSRQGDGGSHATVVTLVEEALFNIITVFYALMPVYSLLMPVWHREELAGKTSVSLPSRSPLVHVASRAHANFGRMSLDSAVLDKAHWDVHGEDNAAVSEAAAGMAGQVHHSVFDDADVSPLRMWDVMEQHWDQQQKLLRSEGAPAAMWWWRLLPLWISTTTDALRLRFFLTSSDADGREALVEQMDALVARAAHLLRDTLRFNLHDLERNRGGRRLLGWISSDTNSQALGNGDGKDLSTNMNTGGDVTTEEEGDAGTKGDAAMGEEDRGPGFAAPRSGNADGGAEAVAIDAPPPLRRQRGKRSLFYQTPQDAGGGGGGVLRRDDRGVTQGGTNGGSSACGTTRSRFQSRSRSESGLRMQAALAEAGIGVGSAAGEDDDGAAAAGMGHHHRQKLPPQDGSQHTSPLFEVLVLSRETPALLSHLYQLSTHQRPESFEVAWAAGVHAMHELWQLLYALPPAASMAATAAAAESSRRSSGGGGQSHRITALRNALPHAVVSLVATPSTAAKSGHPVTTRGTFGKASPKCATECRPTKDEEEQALGRVLYGLQKAQQHLGLDVFESLQHVLTALAHALLRIEQLRDIRSPTQRLVTNRELSSIRYATDERKRQRQNFIAILVSGATILLAGNTFAWDSVQASWQLQFGGGFSGGKGTAALPPEVRHAIPGMPAWSVRSVATSDFGVQWVQAMAKDLPVLHLLYAQQPATVVANAQETLRVLQNPAMSAALQPFAKQVSMAFLLRSLTVFAGQRRFWRGSSHREFGESEVTAPTVVSRDAVLRIYEGVLELLRGDFELRHLCGYAAFLNELFEVQINLKADHAALIRWADEYLLPSLLPVVVAGLQRSQSTHNAATHAELCETTLALLSSLSRYAVNPQVAVADVLRTQWNQVLLQVCMYCIRTMGRGGLKRAVDGGLSPPALPSLGDSAATDAAPTAAAMRWVEAVTGGREFIFLALLDSSNILLGSSHPMQPRPVDAAESVKVSLVAYLTHWNEQIRFADRQPGIPPPPPLKTVGATSIADSNALLAQLQRTYTSVHAFDQSVAAARKAGAEVAPFLAAKQAKARHFGFLVRFVEQHLRVQERLSRLSEEDLEGAASSRRAASLDPSRPPHLSPTGTLSDVAPLVLLDFVGHLSNGGGWAMVTWACNIAETVAKIELRRHRRIPDAAREAASTAVLSQIRAVPPPQHGAGKPPVNLLKSLLSLSDLMALSNETLLGFHRRSSLRGLLSHPTRDQYRVVTFGLKQATVYVQEVARQYHGDPGHVTDSGAVAAELAGSTPEDEAVTTTVAGEDTHRAAEDGKEDGDEDNVQMWRGSADGLSSRATAVSELLGIAHPPQRARVGIYYTRVWMAYAAKRGVEPSSQTGAATAAAAADIKLHRPTELNRNYRYFLNCLLALVDACMESALLFLHRAQGDSEEDIRLLVEAALLELCRTFALTTQALLHLPAEVRNACCRREEAELLWVSLCIVSMISAVVPRDQKERFFNLRCTEAVHRSFVLTRRLIDTIAARASTTAFATTSGASEVLSSAGNDDDDASSSLACRPLCTALVHGVQLLLRDPQTCQRLTMRLAMRKREQDDLTAMLVALQVMVTSAARYEPGLRVLHHVCSRLSEELCEPLLSESGPAMLSSLSSTGLDVSVTVSSRGAYRVALRDLMAACAAAVHLHHSSSSVEVAHREDSAEAQRKASLSSTTPVLLTVGHSMKLVECDVPTAMRNTVEDAAALEEERRQSLRKSARDEAWHCAVDLPSSDVDKDEHIGTALSSLLPPGLDEELEGHMVSVADILLSGRVPVAKVIDVVIADAAATVRAAGGRSSHDVHSSSTGPHREAFRPAAAAAAPSRANADARQLAQDDREEEEDPEQATGFIRRIRAFQRHVVELLSSVPLRNIVARPQAEVLFACMGLLHGTVSATKEDHVWALLATKWKAELIDPCDETFREHQAALLELVRARRALYARDMMQEKEATYRLSKTDRDGRDAGGGAGSAVQQNPLRTLSSPPDMFAADAVVDVTGHERGELSMLTAALHGAQQHWSTELFEVLRHDDVRSLVNGEAIKVENGARTEGDRKRLLSTAQRAETDPHTTGISALHAMPDPVPITVMLTILKVLRRRHTECCASGRSPYRASIGGGGRSVKEVAATVSWLASAEAGGAVSIEGVNGAPLDAYAAFAEVFLTYTARSYWLLRPRLEDQAWVVSAIVEKSMSAYPVEGGVRQREWDRVCRQWRLPSTLDHAKAVAGQFFSAKQRHHIATWMDAMDSTTPTSSGDAHSGGSILTNQQTDRSEEMAVLCYMRATALYLHLLSMSVSLFSRLAMHGDLATSSVGVVSRRVQAQLLQQIRPSNGASGGGGSASLAAATREAIQRELKALALQRQTIPEAANRNLCEGAILQFLNVLWCVVRHTDSLTHLATDRMVSLLQEDSQSLPTATVFSRNAIVAYADHLRSMMVGVLQDTLDTILAVGDRMPVPLPQHAVQTLLTSGFSCEPLHLPLPMHDRREDSRGLKRGADEGRLAGHAGRGRATAPAVQIIASHLSTSASTTGVISPDATGLPSATAGAAAVSATSASSAFNPLARAELFVGSPTMLAILSPHFVRSTVTAALQGNLAPPTLLPIASALEFYLSRHGVPLAPLLEATTELLTSCRLRNSALHMYCERLAGELTSRREFRQALAPPTIASAEQGAAGSLANETVISFVAAIARQDVHVTKKTLAHLLHTVMHMRLDIFGQPPVETRQGKLTLVQVGTTVESTLDTTNPLYNPAPPLSRHANGGGGNAGADTVSPTGGGGSSDCCGGGDAGELDDPAAVMASFSLDRWSDATAMTHRRALAALTLSLPAVLEVSMHMDAMRTLDWPERRRALQMIKAADEARRERVILHRSQMQAAIQLGHTTAATARGKEDKRTDAGRPMKQTLPSRSTATAAAATASQVDASLHLEDPYDFGVSLLHLRYALRKIVHASLRRLLHQQGPRMLAEVATMLQLVDPGLQEGAAASGTVPAAGSSQPPLLQHRRHHRPGSGGPVADTALMKAADGHIATSSTTAGLRPAGGSPRPFDGVLAGTTRVVLSRAVLCAQAIGYDSTGASLEIAPASQREQARGQPVLKLPVPALQPSAVAAAISASASAAAHPARKGRTAQAGHSTGKIGLLTKEEKASVHQRVELERDAATTVGLTTVSFTRHDQQRIVRALRFARRNAETRQRRSKLRGRRDRATSSFGPEAMSLHGSTGRLTPSKQSKGSMLERR